MRQGGNRKTTKSRASHTHPKQRVQLAFDPTAEGSNAVDHMGAFLLRSIRA